MKRLLAPTGLGDTRFSLTALAQWLLKHCGIMRQNIPYNRNERIRQRYATGEALSDLAREYGISPQRVYQIVRNRNR
ncbi:helix-turn-helix domain-containing protein [Kamptonema cortianum]|nr:helix-turn-helix domain-containing protein [Kamptonema cortianum]